MMKGAVKEEKPDLLDIMSRRNKGPGVVLTSGACVKFIRQEVHRG